MGKRRAVRRDDRPALEPVQIRSKKLRLRRASAGGRWRGISRTKCFTLQARREAQGPQGAEGQHQECRFK